MPAEFILVLMAVCVIAFTYMDIWGDPREDPRLAGAPAPRPAGPAPLRFEFEGPGGDAAARPSLLAGLAALPRRKLAQGPVMSLKPLAIPAVDDVPVWEFQVLAQATIWFDAQTRLADVTRGGHRATSSLARMGGTLVLQHDLTKPGYAITQI